MGAWNLIFRIAAAIFTAAATVYVLSSEDYLFHYTTQASAQSIERSRRIKKSTSGRDGCFGTGVYLTSLHPKEGEDKILRNNYDGARSSQGRSGNANYFFRFKKEDLPKARKQNSERDIWLCPHEISLDTVDYVCGHIDANVVLKHDKTTGALTEVNFSR